MRIVTFHREGFGAPHLGALIGTDGVLDLTAHHPDQEGFSSALAFLHAGPATWDRARARVANPGAAAQPLAGATLLPPLPNPPLIRDWGTMSEHPKFFLRRRAEQLAARSADPQAAMAAAQADGSLELPPNWFTVPRFYTGNPLNMTGPDTDIAWPGFAQALDYELELAVVVGVGGKDIPVARARDHIFGVTLFNDFTARDTQVAEGSPAGKSKDFDGAYAIGPCIVTLDEIPDLYQLQVQSRLNGVVQTTRSTADMQLSFEDIVSYASRSCTLHPGELFASGTFEGGCGVETGRLLQDGDVIELEAQGIGTLRNTIRRASSAARADGG